MSQTQFNHLGTHVLDTLINLVQNISNFLFKHCRTSWRTHLSFGWYVKNCVVGNYCCRATQCNIPKISQRARATHNVPLLVVSAEIYNFDSRREGNHPCTQFPAFAEQHNIVISRTRRRDHNKQTINVFPRAWRRAEDC